MATVLVIEGNNTLRQEILTLLSTEGYNAVGVDNSLQAIQQIKALEPDVVLCDLVLPDMSSYEVLRTLRSEISNKYIPVIFLAEKIDRSQIRHATTLGADDFVIRPFAAGQLLASVEVQLNRREHAVEFAEQKFTELRNHLMASLPHELRTPLTSILGFSEVLRTDASDMTSDQVLECANQINESAIRLWHIAENYLTFVELELMGSSLQSQQVLHSSFTADASFLISACAGLLAEKAQRSSDLDFHLCERQAALCISEPHLHKILAELVSNALKFSEPGTPITISGYMERNCYLLGITNQGRGMTPDQIANIAAYRQFDRDIYEQQGCGLGLVIARRLAELHGGELIIESQPGQEITVWVRLPLVENVEWSPVATLC